MSSRTASLIRLMKSSALLDQGVPSSRYSWVVLILEQYFLSALEVSSSAAFDMMASGPPIYLENCFTAWRNSDLSFMGTAYTKPLSVKNSWKQVFPREDLSAFFVEKKVSMKKGSFIFYTSACGCLYHSCGRE